MRKILFLATFAFIGTGCLPSPVPNYQRSPVPVVPTTVPTVAPTVVPVPVPTSAPAVPTPVPTVVPTPVPTILPTPMPTAAPVTPVPATPVPGPIVNSNGQTISGAGFIDSIGINSHFSYGGTIYTSNEPLVVDAILGLHIKHMREGMLIPFERQFSTYQDAIHRLSAAGVRNIGGMQESDLTAPDVATRWSTWFDAIGGLNWVEATEAPNECDLNGCLPRVAAYQKILYNTIKNYAPSNSVQVYGPSLAIQSSYAKAGDLTSYLDYGNSHMYTLSQPPETAGFCKVSDYCAGGDSTGGNIGNTFSLESLLSYASNVSGSKPVINTETGYCTTVLNGSDTQYNNIPEDVQAAYWPRYLLHAYGDLNIKRSFIYDIADDGLSPPTFDKCGLIDNTGRQKPAYKILKVLTDVASTSTSTLVTPLNFTVNAPVNIDGANVKSMALDTGMGTYSIVVWNPVSEWYQISGNGGNPSHSIKSDPIDATVIVPTGFATATVISFDPATGDSQSTVISSPFSIPVSVTPVITIITLK